ncbi:MAG: molybdenum cofactor guanylyltransferase [Pseudomonadota bacterium]
MNDADERMRRISAIVLAGGESLRMGSNKALLDYRGQPLWRHLHDVLTQAGCGQVLISGTLPDLRAGEETIPDITPGLGPLAGIAAVIASQKEALSARWILVVPVDLPLLTPAAVRQLCLQGAGEPGFPANSAHYANHALPALFRNTAAFRRALTTLLGATCARARSVTALHTLLGAQVLPLPEELAPALTNTNTPEDWASICLPANN